jgi:hypothetical protein
MPQVQLPIFPAGSVEITTSNAVLTGRSEPAVRLLKITGGRPGSGEQLNQVSFDGVSVVVHPKAPPKKLGAATLYLNGSRDAANALLDGGKSYHLFAPPNARKTVRTAVYDAETAAFIGDSPDVEINSHQNAQKNADGSADVF